MYSISFSGSSRVFSMSMYADSVLTPGALEVLTEGVGLFDTCGGGGGEGGNSEASGEDGSFARACFRWSSILSRYAAFNSFTLLNPSLRKQLTHSIRKTSEEHHLTFVLSYLISLCISRIRCRAFDEWQESASHVLEPIFVGKLSNVEQLLLKCGEGLGLEKVSCGVDFELYISSH